MSTQWNWNGTSGNITVLHDILKFKRMNLKINECGEKVKKERYEKETKDNEN